MSITELFLPSIRIRLPKRYLLIVAAAVWTFAGGMLYYKGFTMMVLYPKTIWFKISACIVAGTTFYGLIFSKISTKHTQRIVTLPNAKPCLFSVFNWQSYLMMVLMISLGILLRNQELYHPNIFPLSTSPWALH